MTSTVVFDLDGTLVDSNAIKRQGFFDVVDAHAGGRQRMAAVLDRVGDRRAVFAAYLDDCRRVGCAPAQGLDALVRSYSDRVDALVVAAPDMPGATALLDHLRRHGRLLYVSSATPAASLHDILERRRWAHYFAGSFGYPATKADTLRRILDLSGGSVGSLAVVGDGADDRASAASIGCAFYAVGEARGSSAAERVYTLAELRTLLLEPTECATR